MEKILKIEEFEDRNVGRFGGYDGYEITTSDRKIELAISNGQCWCESFGSLQSEDDIASFVGSEVISLKFSDCADWDEIELVEKSEQAEYRDVFDCGFIDIETDYGKLQFAVYNNHNGYYGHDIVVRETKV